MRLRALALVLLVTGCSGTAHATAPACRLTSMEHGTATEQEQVRARAKAVLAEPGRSTRAQLAAVLQVVDSQVALPTSLPTPLASALSPGGRPYGLPSLDEALQHLREACR